jgi:hypothetical protein
LDLSLSTIVVSANSLSPKAMAPTWLFSLLDHHPLSSLLSLDLCQALGPVGSIGVFFGKKASFRVVKF